MIFLTRNKKSLIYAGLFFVCYFIYFLWIVNPSLFLIKSYREFFTGMHFFKQYFSFPGNPAEYISRLFTQFFNIPIIAALLVLCLLVAIYLLGVFSFKKEKENLVLPFLPVLVLMVMHNDYGHSMKFDVNVLLLFGISFFYFRVLRRSERFRLLIYPLILSFLLYFSGFVIAILFFLLVVISIIKKKINIILFMIESIAIVFLFHFLFHLTLNDVAQEVADNVRIYTFSYLPFVLYLSVLVGVVFYDFLIIQRSKNEKQNWQSGLKKSYVFPAVLVLIAAVVVLTFRKEQKYQLSVRYHALNKNWDKVLVFSEKCDYPDKNVAYYTNEALYYTGRIYTDLFRYNQTFGSAGLFATEITNFSEIIPNQDIYLQLGALSLSVVWGTEATNTYGANPYVLKNLTKAYLAEGCTKEAQKMLNLLDNSLFNDKWVRKYQKLVNDTSLINNDPELSGYRKSQLPAAVVSTTSVELNLYLLSRGSDTNKMAFDYLLISTLLDNKINDFATCLSGLTVFGYKSIPNLYFEGILYYSLFSQQSPINFREFTFDRNLIDRFEAFRRDFSALKTSPEIARENLWAKYGDTYWYYILFQSPISDDERKDASARLSL